MNKIPSKVHAVLDYAGGAALLAGPSALKLRDPRAALLLRAAGAGALAVSALTDYELGVRRRIPLKVHLALDAAVGLALAGASTRLRGGAARDWMVPLLTGAAQIGGALVTESEPGDRQGAGAPADRGAAATVPGANGAAPPSGTMAMGASAAAAVGSASTGASASAGAAEPPAEPLSGTAPPADTQGVVTPIAAPPIETPGPSVPAPAFPESETEREERADALATDPEDPFDATPQVDVAEEEAAAAAEAAAIGGPAPVGVDDDPAMGPVYEAGGGEAEGFEAAEEDLIRNATHDDGRGNPLRDAISPELEADLATGEAGEADELPSTEVVEDPETGPEDPGEGPGLPAER